MRRMLRFLLILPLLAAPAIHVAGQPRPLVTAEAFDDVTVGRPRVAAAADGSFAVAWEALRPSGEWNVAVQRFSPAGLPAGEVAYLEPEVRCLDGDFWSGDFVEDVDLAFLPGGMLLVALVHAGHYSDDTSNSEVTLGVVDPDGQVVDLDPSSHCTQMKLVFYGSPSDDERPRLAVTPDGIPLVAADGLFDGARFANVAISLVDLSAGVRAAQFIPHDDPTSLEAVHLYPDLAAGGGRMVATWHECPLLDAAGTTGPCDVRARFFTVGAGGAIEALGGIVPVADGSGAGAIGLRPAAAMNAAGESVLVWMDSRTGPQGDIFAQRFDAAGRPVGGNLRVSTGTGAVEDRPEVALHDDGRFAVVWTEASAAGFRARGRRFDAAGGPLGPPVAFDEASGIHSGQPDVAATGAGYLTVWGRETDGGSTAIYADGAGKVVARAEDVAPPEGAVLLESYPNPFREAATLAYRLPAPAAVRLAVYDVHGREVAVLVDGRQAAGRYEVRFEAGALASGVYLCRLTAGPVRRTHRLLLFR